MRYLQHANTSARWTSVDAAPRRFGVRTSRDRAGISLLEVMFSIGVVMIGLVGIAALLPVAGAQARKGAVADAAARFGANAVREFHVRSMGNPATWLYGTGFSRVWNPQTSAFLPPFDAHSSFCLDPRSVARVPSNDTFPSGGTIWMKRITTSYNPQVADQIFASGDGLVFDLPQDRTLGPVQNFSLGPPPPPPLLPPPLKRSTDGTISWMATIVPRLDLWGHLTKEYTLSVVVFSRRIVGVTPANESFVVAGNFFAGELQLNTDLQLRSGNWVMLSAAIPPQNIIQVHNWYRVANVAEFDATANVLNVTLLGPDWYWGNRPQVTIVPGVVAVFEKTIRLETTSLWTN